MAKILSHVWSTISGSVGGITYLNGPHHAIIARARVNPVQPGSTNQTLARSAWAGAAADWEIQTEQIQADWELYAKTCTFQGHQGNYTVTGRSMFMAGIAMQKYFFLRLLAVPNIVYTAPVVAGFLLPSNLHLTAPAAPGTGFCFNFQSDPNDDTAMFIQTSGPFDKEKHFWKGPWDDRQDLVDVVPAAAAGIQDVVNLIAGKTYFVRAKAVADDAPSRTSIEYFLRTTAVVTGP